VADKASPKLNVYALGTRGVNIVKSPLHLDDNELLQAQNAEPSLDAREGGLQKRGGLTALTAALNGGTSVLGLCNLPLQTTYTRTLYAALYAEDAGETWLTTLDGTTWAVASAPQKAAGGNALATGSGGDAGPYAEVFSHRLASYKGRIIYPGDDYVPSNASGHTAPPLRMWDGSADSELIRVPVGPGATAGYNVAFISDMVMLEGRLYFGTLEFGATTGGRVLSLDLTTGIIKQIGNSWGSGTSEFNPSAGGYPISLVGYRGQLFAGSWNTGGGVDGGVARINPTATGDTWTLDTTFTDRQVTSMCVYKGQLYAGTDGDSSIAGQVYVRSASAGTWAISDTGPGGTTVSTKSYTSMCVFDGNLYAVYHERVTPVLVVRKFDGTSWTTDKTVTSLTLAGTPSFAAVKPGNAVVFNNKLYIAFAATSTTGLDGFILERDTAGTWTVVQEGANIRGYLGVLTQRS
jgi:hypothetical protein